MPRQEGSIGSNGEEDVHLINNIAWEIGSFIFHIYSWFEHIKTELLLMSPAVQESEDTMKQLKKHGHQHLKSQK